MVLNGRYAGRKAVIVKNFDEGTSSRPYGHALVVGINNYPRKARAATLRSSLQACSGTRGSLPCRRSARNLAAAAAVSFPEQPANPARHTDREGADSEGEGQEVPRQGALAAHSLMNALIIFILRRHAACLVTAEGHTLPAA